MHLARREAEVAINGLLRRFPRYVIVEEEIEQYPDRSTVAGWVTLPAVLEPDSA
jgi:cytochrome P450